MSRIIYGQKVMVPTKTYEDYPEIREHIEEMTRKGFIHETGLEPTHMEWFHEPEWTYEVDGETVTVPPMSMLIVEGLQP